MRTDEMLKVQEMHDEMYAEIERLRAALKGVFLLALTSNEIRPDCKAMREAGKLLGASGKVD